MDDHDESINEQSGSIQRPDVPFPRHDKRTLHVTGLPAGSTYKDLVDAVRGGRVLDIVKFKDHSAKVTMLEGAAEFLAYVKRNDLYIKNKRVSFSSAVWQQQN